MKCIHDLAERETACADGACPLCLAKQFVAAEKLCELYFNIAAEVLGEDEVRRRRDSKLPPAAV